MSACTETTPESGQQTEALKPSSEASSETPTTEPTQVIVSPTPEGESIVSIQGESHKSPLASQLVGNISGIVTVIRSDGFYMQSATPDDNPATSEGIFVFTEWIPTVKLGDEVLVSGRVEEYTPGGGYGNLSTTRIKDPEVEILSRRNALPEPTIIGADGRMPPTEIIDDDTNGYISGKGVFDPCTDGIDFYESLEGMLVQVNNAVVVGPTNSYKEIVVLADGGSHAGLRTPRGGIVIQADDFNPERIILDDLLVDMPFVNVGDYSEKPIIGVMDYDFGNYKFLVTERPSFSSGGLTPEEPLGLIDEGQIRIACYNVLNLSAVETRRIALLAEQIVNRMASPDIIGLQEIQDNDGSGFTTPEADLTYQAIIDAILDLGGPQYGYLDIAPIPDADGGAPAGNIRVGYLFRLDRGLRLIDAPRGDAKTGIKIIDESGDPFPSLNPGRIDPANPAFYDSRKPLVVTFLHKGEPLFVINTHFASKGPDRDLFGEFQPPLLDSEPQRLEQAQIVHDFVAEILSIDPGARVVVLGDMNDFYFSPPIDLLEGEILINLIETLPLEERYSYIYDGNSQTLDQMLASEGMMSGFVSMDVLHINSEFDYQSRFSDHDPLIATFDLP